jgi:hypothetical protein
MLAGAIRALSAAVIQIWRVELGVEVPMPSSMARWMSPSEMVGVMRIADDAHFPQELIHRRDFLAHTCP